MSENLWLTFVRLSTENNENIKCAGSVLNVDIGLSGMYILFENYIGSIE